MRSILSVILFAICMVSCQDSISLDQIQGVNKLVVYAFPTANDTIVINVSASQPVNAKAEQLSVKHVRCATNGQDDSVVLAGNSHGSGTMVITYYAIGKHQYGDEVRITVEDDKLPTASGTTHIPYPTNIEDVKMDTTFYKGSLYNQIRLSFNDNDRSTYYAVRVCGMYVPEDEMTKGKTEFVELETSAEPILNKYSNAELEFGSWNDYYHSMYIFEDSSFKDKGATLHLCTLQKGWIENYKTELITLSYDYYRMLKSLNDIKNNDIGSNGLSFMFSTYTNVQGGYGCVAGYSMEETSWIK